MQPGSFPGAPSLDVGVPTNAIPDGTSATTLFFASIVHDGVQVYAWVGCWGIMSCFKHGARLAASATWARLSMLDIDSLCQA